MTIERLEKLREEVERAAALVSDLTVPGEFGEYSRRVGNAADMLGSYLSDVEDAIADWRREAAAGSRTGTASEREWNAEDAR